VKWRKGSSRGKVDTNREILDPNQPSFLRSFSNSHHSSEQHLGRNLPKSSRNKCRCAIRTVLATTIKQNSLFFCTFSYSRSLLLDLSFLTARVYGCCFFLDWCWRCPSSLSSLMWSRDLGALTWGMFYSSSLYPSVSSYNHKQCIVEPGL